MFFLSPFKRVFNFLSTIYQRVFVFNFSSFKNFICSLVYSPIEKYTDYQTVYVEESGFVRFLGRDFISATRTSYTIVDKSVTTEMYFERGVSAARKHSILLIA